MNRCENTPPVKRAQKDIWSWLYYSLTAGCLLFSFCLCLLSPPLSVISVRPLSITLAQSFFLFSLSTSVFSGACPGVLIIPQASSVALADSSINRGKKRQLSGLARHGLWWYNHLLTWTACLAHSSSSHCFRLLTIEQALQGQTESGPERASGTRSLHHTITLV